MKQNSLEADKKHATSSSSTSSSSDHHQIPIAAFDDIPVHSDNDLAYVQREIRDSMMRRESLLDEFCDRVVDEKSVFSHATTIKAATTKIKKLELASSPTALANNIQTQATGHTYNHGKSNGSVVGGKSSIDAKKKNQLLAALKHIDNNGSFET